MRNIALEQISFKGMDNEIDSRRYYYYIIIIISELEIKRKDCVS